MSEASLSDDDFLQAFEAGTLEGFRHWDHIRLAWLYVSRYGFDEGSNRVISGIKSFAASHGATQLYHETITRFWISAVQAAIEESPDCDFAEFMKSNPHLESNDHIYNFYSKELLMSPDARRNWIAPLVRGPESKVLVGEL
jgi:ADP-ribosylation factor protein 1